MANSIIEKILRIKDEASPALKDTSDAADDAADKLKDTDKASESVSASFSNMAKKATAAAAVVAAVGAAVFKLNQRLADARNELIDTATRTGLATKTIAGLKLAAEGSGQQLNALAAGLGQFPKRMADAARGTGEALVAFEKLGISVLDANDNMKSADQVIREVSAAINMVEDPTERSALAVQAFGRSGANLMVALGGKELDQFIEQAERFGVQVGPNAAKAADDWQRSVALMGTTFDGTIDRIASAVFGGGGMSEVVNSMSAAMAGLANFVQTVLDQFRAGVENIMVALIHAGKVMRAVLSRDFEGAGQAFDNFKARMQSGIKGIAGTALLAGTGPGVFMAAARTSMEATATGAGAGAGAGTGAFRRPGKESETAAKAAASELDALAKQVAILTNKAFPTTQIDESTKLIEALTAARDRARKSRRDDFDALIADAKRARGELQSVEIRKWADTTASALATAQDGVANLNSEIEALAESAAQMLADRRAAMFGAATAGVGALSDVGGLVGGMGPAGGLVAAISGAGQQAAGTEGGLSAMVKANVEGFVEGIKVLIKEFPSIITDVLPDLIGTLVPELIFALVEAAPHIAKAIIIDLPAALSQGFLEAFGKVFKQVKDFFKQLFLNLIPGRQKGERGGKTVLEGIGDFAKDVGKGLANLLTFGLVDSKQTGGFVNRTGLHLLHQGEFVQANSGTIPQSARGRMGGGGGAVNITINTNVVDPNSIDQLGRLLQRHFGGMGRSTLPIFGGA